MRAISFYLPQYHPIPENDLWWGRGFTEWTNVAAARPLFRGHHQPHVPADLGFYDLRLEESRVAQAELAKQYGVSGFCYYHYWFNGKQLLERPFDEVLASGRPDLPFCLCWANGNWTRRWDGREQDVLMGQDYSSYSPAAHFRWLASAFRDPRYITIDGRPLFLVYDAAAIPDRGRVVAGWREAARREGLPDPYVCGVFSPGNPLKYEDFMEAGFDAVTDFYPNGERPLVGMLGSRTGRATVDLLKRVRGRVREFLPERDRPVVHSYRDLVASVIGSAPRGENVFPCVMPTWDNTPRRGRRATIIQNGDAGLYAEWLREAVRRVEDRRPEERIVFINAWNEWGEGCHLEPDTRYGRRFLEATGEVLGEARARLEEDAPRLNALTA
jgi:lipopolysaccharide biosynthesis protein